MLLSFLMSLLPLLSFYRAYLAGVSLADVHLDGVHLDGASLAGCGFG